MRHLTEIGEPLWLEAARRDLGVREGRDDARIVRMHQRTGLKAQSSKVPWCSSAMCDWFESVGIRSTRSAAAKSWATWGRACDLEPGAVAVFGKHDPDAKGTGHVALVVGVEGDDVLVLGGNQRNAVNVARRPRAAIVATRWPIV